MTTSNVTRIIDNALITIDGHELKVSVDQTLWPSRGERIPAHARAYCWLNDSSLPSDQVVRDQAFKLGLDSIHTVRGESPEMDAAWDAHNREIVKTQRRFVEEIILRQLSNLSGGSFRLDQKVERFKFSTKAGCSCGCSPGWILKGISGSFSFYITEIDHAAEAKAAAEKVRAANEAFDAAI